ncbi:MAG: hypothetical protein ACTHNO_00160 [Ralstonia sp.]|uniref:hypothetical protein n=1 Tax=Ralstonia sp. TaxID=54061 RepID=UPI003F7FB3A8
MGILIPFPQPRTRVQPGRPPSGKSAPKDACLAATYRRDLDRAVSLLLEHVQSDAYDGVALILKPKSPAHKPALVVGGLYRHRLNDAVAAAMQLHLAIKLRAREQASQSHPSDAKALPQPATGSSDAALETKMQYTVEDQWNEAKERYHRCEHMLRIAFSKQLRASPETTAILLGITQLHIETVASCLAELVVQNGQATPQERRETQNAIQLFRRLRSQVSAWMPPPGQETAYLIANESALSEEMLKEANTLLEEVLLALTTIAGNSSAEPTGRQKLHK